MRSKSASHRIHKQHPHATHRGQLSCSGSRGQMRVWACLPRLTRPTRQTLRGSVHLAVWVLHASTTAFVHSARAPCPGGTPIRPAGVLEVLVCVGRTRNNASPLTLDYVTCTSLAATSRLNNTNTSPHHVVNKHHTIIMQERPLDMTCFSRAHLLPFRHTTYNNQAQAPRKSVMQARCTLSRVPRTRRRHLISQLGELRVSPHL